MAHLWHGLVEWVKSRENRTVPHSAPVQSLSIRPRATEPKLTQRKNTLSGMAGVRYSITSTNNSLMNTVITTTFAPARYVIYMKHEHASYLEAILIMIWK